MSPSLEEQTRAAEVIAAEHAKTNGESELFPATDTNLYDADAVNQLKFDGIIDDMEIRAEFLPETDDVFIAFDKKAATKLSDDGADISGRSEAFIYLFDTLCGDIDGFEGERPENWKAQLDADQIKIPVAQHFSTVAVYTEPFKWGQTEQAIVSERYFNGKEVRCRHFLRKKTIDDVKAFRKLQKIPTGAKTKGLHAAEIIIPGYAEKKGLLYDQMATKAPEGYAGRVPLRDKTEVIDFIFSAGLKGKR